jgi:voltage-gated potassium channel
VDSAPIGSTGHQRPTGLTAAVPVPAGVPVRGPVLWALARALVNTTALVLLYYLLPLNRPVSWKTLGWLLGGLVLVALLVARQIRAILRARYPSLRAIEALATSIPLFLLVFAAAYQMLAASDPSSFSEHLTRTDTLYFVVTVFATVGFGDITAVRETARVLVMVQMLGDLVLIGLVIRAFLAAVDRGRQRQQQERTETGDGEHRPG